MKRLSTTGTLKQKTQKKVIMEGVNLKLEQGKMYLILGAPGCGKSTCEFDPSYVFCFVMGFVIVFSLTCLRNRIVLKMIANILPQDKKHVVGGSVEVNGVDSNDEDIVWS